MHIHEPLVNGACIVLNVLSTSLINRIIFRGCYNRLAMIIWKNSEGQRSRKHTDWRHIDTLRSAEVSVINAFRTQQSGSFSTYGWTNAWHQLWGSSTGCQSMWAEREQSGKRSGAGRKSDERERSGERARQKTVEREREGWGAGSERGAG